MAALREALVARHAWLTKWFGRGSDPRVCHRRRFTDSHIDLLLDSRSLPARATRKHPRTDPSVCTPPQPLRLPTLALYIKLAHGGHTVMPCSSCRMFYGHCLLLFVFFTHSLTWWLIHSLQHLHLEFASPTQSRFSEQSVAPSG